MSAAVAVQTPPATVAVVVTVVLPSVKCTVTVWPSSTPEVVPDTTKVLSSAALTMLSPASVVSIAMVGATLSSATVLLASVAGRGCRWRR